MKYLLFSTSTEKYLFSNVLPSDQDNFDIIDLESKQVLSGFYTGPMEEYTEGGDKEEAEAPTQEIEPLPTDEAA